MDENLLQMLGYQSPGIVAPEYSDATPYAPPPAPIDPTAAAPQGVPAMPPQAAPNVLQALTGGTTDAAAPSPTRPARARSSFLDILGRASDVLAKVGGAQALYQPTLDARQDREIALGDHDRSVVSTGLNQNLTRQQIEEGRFTALTKQNVLTTAAVKRLNAIIAANPNADVSKIWPVLASQAGLTPDKATALAQMFANDPESIKAIAAASDKDNETYSGSVIYANGPDGKLHAFQAGTSANAGRDILPPGYSAVDPAQFINLGGQTVGIGKYGSTPRVIMPNSEKPGQAADRTQKGEIASNRNATELAIAGARNNTAVTIAGMPARGKTGDAKGGGDASGTLKLLADIQKGFDDLHGMNALPGDNGGVVGNVLGALGRTHVGQALGAQAGMAPAQKRLEIMKNVSQLQQAMLKSLPASATRTKFEQEMLARGLPDPSNMSYNTARTVIGQLRDSFARAQAELAAKRPVAAPARAPIKPRDNSGGWALVGVK